MKQFIFLICSERSGSNFITALMNGHSQISGPPPTHLFRLFASNGDRYGDLSDDRKWQTLVSDFSENLGNSLGEWNTKSTAESLMAAKIDRNVASLLRCIYEKEAESAQASHVFVKENHSFKGAPFLLAQFPGCRFLFSVRDPRDVALSWKLTNSIPGGITEAIDVWLDDQQKSVDLHSQLRTSGMIYAMRYEDLLLQTEVELEKILLWLGLEYEKEMMAFHENSRTKSNASRIDAWKNTGSSIMRDNATKYLSGLTRDEIRYIELRCSDLMETFGYELENEDIEYLSSDERLAESVRLCRSFNDGEYILNANERRIRDSRLSGISKVLSRPSAKLF